MKNKLCYYSVTFMDGCIVSKVEIEAKDNDDAKVRFLTTFKNCKFIRSRKVAVKK